MKAFRFPLQSIRVLREQKEQLAQQRFADAVRLCEAAAFQLQNATEDLAASWNSLGDELSKGVTATKLARTRAWCHVLELRQKDCTAALEKARLAMETASQALMAARRDREALDRYHDKCRRSYDREAQRELQKTLDELGVRRAGTAGLLRRSRRLESDL